MNERIPALKREEAPRVRRGKKLLWILIALFLIVLVVLFFRSSLSKFSEIQVSGTDSVSQEEVMKALDVVPGDSFFAPSSDRLKARVLTLKPVEDVTITKKFPGVLKVDVKEYAKVAVQLSPDGKMFTVLANGLNLPIVEGNLPDKPILSGWKPEDPNLIALCRTLSGVPDHFLTDLSEIHSDPSTAYPDRIKLFTRSRFEVVTTVGKLADKISYLSDIVQNREPGKVMMLEADTYLPYSAETAPPASPEADKLKEKDTTQ
jgi:cell division protein FtsQ